MTATPSHPVALPATVGEGFALLERAIGYTLGSLVLVDPGHMTAPTPCSRWDLRRLLRHMDESLRTLHQALPLHRLRGRRRDRGCRRWRRHCARAGALVAIDDVIRRHRQRVAARRRRRLGSQRAAGGKQQGRQCDINGFHEGLLG